MNKCGYHNFLFPHLQMAELLTYLSLALVPVIKSEFIIWLDVSILEY